MNSTPEPSEPQGTPGPEARPAGTDPGPGPRPAATDTEKLRNVLLFLPRLAALIGRLVLDAEVSALDKALLGAVVLYIASPIDILPDFLPFLGQLDDLYIVALVLLRLLNRSGPEKLRQHWEGPEDIVQILNSVTDFATRYLPETVRNRLREWVEARATPGPPPPSTPA
jgi:uncharacterized membrane protein YkvA (DUF1232 family)